MNDPNLARMRPVLLRENAGDPLTDGFALHSALDPLRRLWAAGELAFAPAVSTPYRGQRSHFDGQDMLEAGTGMDVAPDALRGGMAQPDAVWFARRRKRNGFCHWS